MCIAGWGSNFSLWSMSLNSPIGFDGINELAIQQGDANALASRSFHAKCLAPIVERVLALAFLFGLFWFLGASCCYLPLSSRFFGPRSPQGCPKRPQDGPKTAPRAPRQPQDGPKMAQDGPKMAPRRPQDGSLISWALSGLKATKKQAKSKHLRWSTSVSVRFFAPLRHFPLFRNKFWGAAACPPQAFSIRPLPGFSLGAVLELFCLTRLSQSVLVCLKTHEFSPRTPAHSAGPSSLWGPRAILWMSNGMELPLTPPTRFYCDFQNLSFTKAKLGFRA